MSSNFVKWGMRVVFGSLMLIAVAIAVGWVPEQARTQRNGIDDARLLTDAWSMIRHYVRCNANEWPESWESLQAFASSEEIYDEAHRTKIRNRIDIDFGIDLTKQDDPSETSFIRSKHAHAATAAMEDAIAADAWELISSIREPPLSTSSANPAVRP